MATIDKANLNQMLTKLELADTKLSKVMDEIEAQRQNVYTSYHMLKGNSSDAMLKEMDISELNRDKSGIRVQILYDNGIHTIDQIIQLTPAELAQKVDGVGIESAKKIMEKANELKASSEKYAKVTLDAKSNNRDMQKLMVSLAYLVNTQQLTSQMEKLYNENHPQIVHYLPKAKKMKSTIGWFFVSKKAKEESQHAYEQLLQLDADALEQKVQALTKEFQTIARAQNLRKAQNDYETNAATFYALLEQIVGSQGASWDAAQSKSYLPQELVTAIDAFPIDLSLMKSTLRNYQVFGTKYVLHQRKVLLGDEMGLGKTMQAIAAISHLKASGKTHFIVVCPVSVMVNWTREIEKHSQMTAIMIHGSDRGQEYEQWLTEGGIAITTFETITKLEISEWVTVDLLVVDEAHYVKNPKAQRTQALLKIAGMAEYILFMSGTPLENKVEEMQFLISILNTEIANQIKNLNSIEVAEAFREKIAPVYLRRVREDVLKELPEKIEKQQWCQLGAEEIKSYKQALKDGGYMQVRKVSWNVDDLTKSAKANRLLEICEQAKEEGRRIIVFSFFLEVIEKVQSLLGERCYGPITGGVSADERQRLIDEFSKSDPGSVLACQIIAAGTGLNIQAASVVIICEPQWKPSTETQAISRAYRMGQTQTVVVHRLLADDTVDERIMEVLQGKTELFENFADESMIGELDKELLAKQEAEQEALGKQEPLLTDPNVIANGTQENAMEQRQDIDEKKQGSYMKDIVAKEREKYGVEA